ncbi:MAG: pectin acetylesterase-family hydrolase [Candidatus Competibacteraceae bacterium]
MNKKSAVSQGAAVRWIAALALLALPLVDSAAAVSPWVEKPVASSVTVAGKNYPTGCAFQSPYRYFLQKITDSNNVLILLDGGGACWDTNTCGLNPPVEPTFFPFVTESVDHNGRLVDPGPRSLETGVLADNPTDNPFQNYTKVFVPYCTGDLFWGNKDKSYGPVTIHHRGYGNLLAVLDSLWSEQNYASAPPGKVVIAGTSAGAYGAIAAFVEVEKRLPKTNKPKTLTYLIADSGNGIVVNDFLHRAVNAPDSSWGVRENGGTLPDYLLDDLQEAFGLSVRIYGELTRRYSKSRFAQIQNAYDSVQVGFLNTMKYVNDPSRWVDPNYLLPSLAEWAARMRTAVNLSAAAANYRFYTAAGSEHIMLIDVPPEAQFGFCSDLFYQENSAAGVKLTDWVRDMVNTSSLWSTGRWRNATCFPHCLTATPRCPTPSS